MPATTTQPEHLWFLDTLVRVRIAHTEGPDGISILEHRAPYRDSPPLHVHATEDEVFHILEGKFRLRIGKEDHIHGPGDTVIAPKGVPHTYRIDSANGGRWLTITVRGDFERFVRAMGRPAARPELPPSSGKPTPEAIAALTAKAHQFGIEMVGPPLD
jgi:quercetin dioxygenase-like cupin family protein